MKIIVTIFLSCMLICSCKHDHKHGPDGHSHDNDQSKVHAEHDHDGHSHEGHDHSSHEHTSQQEQLANTLSNQEQRDGWQLLFDGQKIDSWTGYQSDISPKWVVNDGTLFFNPKTKGHGGDIITKDQYENFELALEWKISNCGNSGIFWNVVDREDLDRTFHSGPEMQILDNTCHPDAKIIKHRAGDLYDLIETSINTVKPAMEWNSIRIHSKDGSYMFYQNDVKVVEFTMHTPEWDEMIANSKFKEWPAFGKAKRGHIALQDHGNEVWFRNIKIREI